MNLLPFIKTQFSSIGPRPTTQLSNASKQVIVQIVAQMKRASESYMKNHDHIIPKFFYSIPPGKSYHYIADQIKADIENHPIIGKVYSFTIGSRHFNVYLIQKKIDSKTKISNRFDTYIKKIYVWLFVASAVASDTCSPNLNIYIYMTDHTKILPSNHGEPIDTIHVNTAFTMSCPLDQNEIHIYRKEEWFKVLIHECFHSMGLDFSNMSNQSHEKVDRQIFSIFTNLPHIDVRFYETYSEMWAEIIHVIFICVNNYPCSESSIQIHRLSNQIDEYLYYEQIFSLFHS